MNVSSLHHAHSENQEGTAVSRMRQINPSFAEVIGYDSRSRGTVCHSPLAFQQ